MNLLRLKHLVMAGVLLAAFGLNAETLKLGPATSEPSWPKADPAAVARWQALRFGMFIHWGPVSLTGHEIGWSRGAQTPIEVYDNLYKQFNPTNFNADEWVNIAKAAGMKYIVLTTKHHDGFCLWDTKLTDYNIMRTPFHRDVVKELAAACKKQGIAFGTYYSTCDWYNTNWPTTSPGGNVKRETSDMDAYEKYLQGQITELINNYGPLVTIWNDVPNFLGANFDKRGAETIKLVRSLQPDILINNRTGDGGDYDTPEQRIGKFQLDRPWESCMTVSAHNAWAWGGANDGVKSTAACLDMLIRGAGGDGNILLNVGPRPDGMIDPAQANRLKDIGAWLAKYGGSIYGTRGGPFMPGDWGASTRASNHIYLHILNWNGDTLRLPALPAKIIAAQVLTGGRIRLKQTADGMTLCVRPFGVNPPWRGAELLRSKHPTPSTWKAFDAIVKLDLDRSAMDLPALDLRKLAPSSGIKASASNVFQEDETEYGAHQAFDKDAQTRWATDSGTKQAWIAADFGKLATFESVRIQEAAPYTGRVTQFEFQYRDGSAWKTIFSGTKIGDRFQKKFAPVKAQEFRLNILDATEGPTIAEIELVEKKP